MAFRLFREQPTAELAASAREVVRTAISPNDRLAQIFHPWSSYVIVPLFALANAGVVLNAGFLARAYTSPVTLGILFGYVVGKPIGTAGARGWCHGSATGGCGRRLAGARSRAPGRSPGSGSRSRC